MGHVTDFYGFNNCGDLDLSQESSELLSRDNLLDLPDISGSCFNEDSYRSSLPSYIQNNTEQNGCFSEPLYDYLFDADDHFNIDFDAPTSVADNEHTDLISDSIISTSSLEVNERKNSLEKLLIENSKIQLDTGQKDGYSPEWDEEIVVDGSKINNYSAETATDPADSDTGISPIPKLIIKLKPDPKSSNTNSLTPMTIADSVKLGNRRSSSFKSDEPVKGNQKKKSKKKRHQRKHFSSKQKEKSYYGSSTDSSFQSKLFVQELVHNQNVDDNLKDGSSDFCEVDNSYPLSLDDENSSDNRPFRINLDVLSDGSSEHNSSFLSTSLDVERVAPLQMKHSELFNVGEPGDSFSFSFDETNTSSELTGQKKELSSFVDSFTEHPSSFSGNIPEHSISLVDETPANAFTVVSKSKKRKKKATLEKNDHKVNHKPPSKKEFSASDLIEELNAHHQQVFEEIEISTPDLELELTDETKCVQDASVSSVQTCNPLPACANESISHQSAVSKYDENDLNFENHMPKDKKSPLDSDSDSVQSKNSNCNSTSYSKSVTNGKSQRCYRKRRDKSSSTSPERELWLNKPVKYDPVTDTYRDEFGCEVRPNEFKSTSDSKHRYRVSRSSSRSRHRNRHRHYKSRSRSRSQKRRKHSSESKGHSYSHKYRDNEYKRRSPSPRHRKRHYMDLEENIKANEERRVMYVGDIPPGYTVEQLKQRFERFGPIQDATIKSKNTSECSVYVFGFVTFKNRSDACAAIENGNTDMWPKFELNFGGRRRFCNGNYTDLDGKIAETESGWYGRPTSSKKQLPPADDFAELLRLEQKRLGMG